MAKTVPCKICGNPTEITKTFLCDDCWEILTRLERLIRKVGFEVLNKIIIHIERVFGIQSH